MDIHSGSGVVESMVDDTRSPFVHRTTPAWKSRTVFPEEEYVIESWVPVLEVRIKTRVVCTVGVCVSL